MCGLLEESFFLVMRWKIVLAQGELARMETSLILSHIEDENDENLGKYLSVAPPCVDSIIPKPNPLRKIR